MAKVSLAVKYRPKKFEDVSGQSSTKTILEQMLSSDDVAHALLFVGSAGTGKTTCARIFADRINDGLGQPIELDAASNSGVDDVRDIIYQSRLKSLDSEYKVFIIDECHSLSNTAWQAFLKLLEEPPEKSIFIFCTTNPEKIPRTILSRVQRFDFQRISQSDIITRLRHICDCELQKEDDLVRLEALEYIAKIADGGMRTAITYLDKVISYSREVTLSNVLSTLGVADYSVMLELTKHIYNGEERGIVETIEKLYASGIDLTRFIRQYINFVLDVKKVNITGTFEYTQLPETDELKEYLTSYNGSSVFKEALDHLLVTLVNLNNTIKYDSSPKSMVEIYLLREVWE